MEREVVKVFDTTLRDGEQSPGATMNIEEKVMIARQLENLNVDVIEAGFAVVRRRLRIGQARGRIGFHTDRSKPRTHQRTRRDPGNQGGRESKASRHPHFHRHL